MHGDLNGGSNMNLLLLDSRLYKIETGEEWFLNEEIIIYDENNFDDAIKTILKEYGIPGCRLFVLDHVYKNLQGVRNVFPISGLLQRVSCFEQRYDGIRAIHIPFVNSSYFVIKDGNKKEYVIYFKNQDFILKDKSKFISSILGLNEEISWENSDGLFHRLNLKVEEMNWSRVDKTFIDLLSMDESEFIFNFSGKSWHKKLAWKIDESWKQYSEGQKEDITEAYRSMSRKKADEYIQCKYFGTKSCDLRVGVVSPFTYGKSAFMNSLLHMPLLQEDILVKTAKVTEISYDDRYIITNKSHLKYAFTYEEYQSADLFKERLSLITTDLELEKCSTIEVMLPHYAKDKRIQYIDTPGLFGKIRGHDDITEAYIKKLDIVIYLLNPLQIGFQPYIEKIKEFQKKYNKKCILVVNKMDLVPKEDDRIKLEQEIRKGILNQIEAEKIFFVSSYFASRARYCQAGYLTMDDIRRDQSLYVKKDLEIMSGRGLVEDDLKIMESMSGIQEVEKFLINETTAQFIN